MPAPALAVAVAIRHLIRCEKESAPAVPRAVGPLFLVAFTINLIGFGSVLITVGTRRIC